MNDTRPIKLDEECALQDETQNEILFESLLSKGGFVAVHTTLRRNLQLEIGKATHSHSITVVALICVAIIVVYNLINFLFLHDNALFLASISFGPCILLVIGAFWGYQPILIVKGQRQFKRLGRWPEYLIRLTDNTVETYSLVTGKTYSHPYSAINSMKETPNLIILISQETITALEKAGLIQGSLEELRALLKEKVDH